MMSYNLYLTPNRSEYINQSLVYYGILLQNDKINIIRNTPLTVGTPYYILHEGIICHPILSNSIRRLENVEVYKNGKLVLKKASSLETPNVYHDENVYDLYDINDNQYVQNIIDEYENNRLFYAINTEPIPKLPNNSFQSLAGVASGSHVAQIAYENKLRYVVFFDYSSESLDLQKMLIESSDRFSTYKNNIDNMTMGYQNASVEDISRIDFNLISKYYDYLKTVDVRFIHVDLRQVSDIEKLVDQIPNDTTLWISNVFHFVSAINSYNSERYKLLDTLCDNKNITLLPYTRIYYEG